MGKECKTFLRPHFGKNFFPSIGWNFLLNPICLQAEGKDEIGDVQLRKRFCKVQLQSVKVCMCLKLFDSTNV